MWPPWRDERGEAPPRACAAESPSLRCLEGQSQHRQALFHPGAKALSLPGTIRPPSHPCYTPVHVLPSAEAAEAMPCAERRSCACRSACAFVVYERIPSAAACTAAVFFLFSATICISAVTFVANVGYMSHVQVALSKDMWPIWMDDCVMSTHAAESRKGGRTSRRAHRVAAADRTVIPPRRRAREKRTDATRSIGWHAYSKMRDAARGLLWLRRGWLSTESSKCAKRRAAVSPLLAAWMPVDGKLKMCEATCCVSSACGVDAIVDRSTAFARPALPRASPGSRALRCQGPRQVLPRVPMSSAWAPQASCVVNIAACRHSMMKSSL